MGHQVKKDDDSEYFLRILLDQTFTRHLKDPQFYTSDVKELAGKLDDMPKNAIFQDIVMSEVETMFGQKFLLKKDTINASAAKEVEMLTPKGRPVAAEMTQSLTQLTQPADPKLRSS